MYIVVTGAAGFIGANIVKALNERGVDNIIAVDNLTRSEKFRNLADCDIADYFHKEDFRMALASGAFDGEVAAILHQGACSDTMETDGRYVMDNNYRYSADLLAYCQSEAVPFIYASSAAVYGASDEFLEERSAEKPLNVYGYSKFLFDQLVRRRWEDNSAQVVGLRYFNVYGPREAHKERMASVAWHFFNQFRETGQVRLFEGSGGFAAGEQRRDFVSVDDVVNVNMWFLENADRSGIFNCGTGASQTFNEVAVATVNSIHRAQGTGEALSLEELKSRGIIQYVPFPDGLKEKYQSFTEADLTQLRECGYEAPFSTVEQGVERYVEWLLQRQ
ncbi:MAG: ADP-glyceromanno-heptose 6-epimerase [Betaproteobacteria bacterium]|nr:MAG: ADP-glyceromanno-heptose 6-epimerase [Betaproteobacteria bacterium]